MPAEYNNWMTTDCRWGSALDGMPLDHFIACASTWPFMCEHFKNARRYELGIRKRSACDTDIMSVSGCLQSLTSWPRVDLSAWACTNRSEDGLASHDAQSAAIDGAS